MRALRYAFDEAAAALWRGRQSGMLSMATIALALFVLGSFLLVTTTIERLAAQWSSAAEVSVYLNDDVSANDRATIEEALAPGPIVESREYVSKAAALARFKATFGDLAAAADTLGGNPFPASYEVRIRPDATARAHVGDLAAQLRRTSGVADVRYDQQWLDRLLRLTDVIRGIGLVLGTLLTIAAALTVANVVRLGLYARRDELDIMRLVGAPQVYIRGPFVMEGVLQGGIGALVALMALAITYAFVRAHYAGALGAVVNFSLVSFLPAELCVAVIVGGMAVGCIGGLVAAWDRSL